jgi:hypothetical protein
MSRSANFSIGRRNFLDFPACFEAQMAVSTLRVLLLALPVLTTSGIMCRSPARRSLAFSHARAAGA